MTDSNRYAPPSAKVEDVTEALERSDYGIKLSASLLWRALLIHMVLAIPLATFLTFSDPSLESIKLAPSIFFFVASSVLVISLLRSNPGLPFFVWGYRLHMPPRNWRRFTFSICAIYLLLGIAHLSFALFAPMEVWLKLQALDPTFAVIALCLVVPRFVARPNPSFKRTRLRRSA